MSDIQQRIAQIIREADGNHTMGAAALAEVLVSELGLRRETRGGTIPFGMDTPKFAPSSRYVTEWVADA